MRFDDCTGKKYNGNKVWSLAKRKWNLFESVFLPFEDKNTETQHDRFANTFGANGISERNAQTNVLAVATVAKWNHSDTHTHAIKTFAFIETLTSIKMAHNGKEPSKCTHKNWMLEFWIESTSVIGKWKMHVAMHAASQKAKRSNASQILRIYGSAELVLHTHVRTHSARSQMLWWLPPHKHNKCWQCEHSWPGPFFCSNICIY